MELSANGEPAPVERIRPVEGVNVEEEQEDLFPYLKYRSSEEEEIRIEDIDLEEKPLTGKDKLLNHFSARSSNH